MNDTTETANHVTREEILLRAGDPSLALVDVLPRAAFEESHIPGSLSLPVEEIPALAREVLPDPSREVVVYCGGPT